MSPANSIPGRLLSEMPSFGTFACWVKQAGIGTLHKVEDIESLWHRFFQWRLERHLNSNGTGSIVRDWQHWVKEVRKANQGGIEA